MNTSEVILALLNVLSFYARLCVEFISDIDRMSFPLHCRSCGSLFFSVRDDNDGNTDSSVKVKGIFVLSIDLIEA